MLSLEPLSVDAQVLNCLVHAEADRQWLLSAIYVSLNPLTRHSLWTYLAALGFGLDVPWLLIGDFNQVICSSEKKGGRMPLQCNIQPLRMMIETCDLLDMGFTSPIFT